MNLLHRLFACAALCGSVACSENGIGFEPAAPEPQFRTVVIGCAGIDITTRTEIDDRLNVRWVSGDCIRLWARESLAAGNAASGFALENTPFVFDYYSPQWSRAAFTGRMVDVSRFDSSRRYDYFAVSPAPVSVAGTSATFDIPAVQSGEFNSGCDIMTAQLTDAVALEEGDTNWWSTPLPFTHHVHVLKITIPTNQLESPKFPGQEEAIRSIELTFPDPVTGQLTVDATGATEPVFTPAEGGNVLTLRFDQPKRAGDVVYAFIARQEPLSGDGKVIIKATGASGGDKPCVSVDRTFVKTREFTRGKVTTLNYNIPERYRCTKILFSLAEKAGGEAPDRAITNANGYGWGTLGEPIESFRIVDKATGEELPASAFVCNHITNKYEITCVDEGSHTPFIERYAGKECIAKLASANAEVEYSFTLPALDAEVENMIPALEVPWLFEEDFSGLTGSFHNDDDADVGNTSHSGSNSAKSLDNYNDSGMPDGWYGARCGGENGAVRICARLECIVNVNGTYHGRIDAPNFEHIKSGAQVRIKASFDYSIARTVYNSDYDRQPYLTVGVTNDENKDASGEVRPKDALLKPCISDVVLQDLDASSDRGGSFTNVNHSVEFAPDNYYTNGHRLVWEVYTHEHEGGTLWKYNTSNNYVYLDNIKVSIAH